MTLRGTGPSGAASGGLGGPNPQRYVLRQEVAVGGMEEEPANASRTVAPIGRHRHAAGAHWPSETRPVVECRDGLTRQPATGVRGNTAAAFVSGHLVKVQERVGDPGGTVAVPEGRRAAQ